jgi:prepilin-type N-terminal cleavage/methylation domain-containing protein
MLKRDGVIKRNDKGFTLIELVIAMLILTVGLLALAELFIASTYTNSFAYNASVEVKAAEQILEQLRSLQFNDPKLTVGGTINASPAPCASGCAADQNHIMGIYFQPVLDTHGRIKHHAMAIAPYSSVATSDFNKRQFEIRWQVIGYPTTAIPANTTMILPFNAYDDLFPATPSNVFPLTPPDASGQTALVVLVRVIPVGAKAKAKLAKRVQLATILSRP